MQCFLLYIDHLHFVLYNRVPCEYQRTNIAFHVNSGSSAYWLGLLVEYVNGDGDLGAVDLKQVGALHT